MQPDNFFSTDATPGTPTRRHALGGLPTPPPPPENLLLGLHRKLPSAPPASTQEVRNPKIGQQLGAQPTPRFRVMIDAIDRRRDQCSDRPMAALHFLLPTGDSRSGRSLVSIPNQSPFSRSTMFPFTSSALPPAPLAIRKAPSASVESIQPKPLQPCEVGRPKGRRHLFDNISDIFSAPRAPQPIPSQSIPFPKAMF